MANSEKEQYIHHTIMRLSLCHGFMVIIHKWRVYIKKDNIVIKRIYKSEIKFQKVLHNIKAICWKEVILKNHVKVKLRINRLFRGIWRANSWEGEGSLKFGKDSISKLKCSMLLKKSILKTSIRLISHRFGSGITFSKTVNQNNNFWIILEFIIF